MTTPTYKLISSVTVGTNNPSTITFDPIPQTYTDLKVFLSLRDTAAIAQVNLNMQFNGSTSSRLQRTMYANIVSVPAAYGYDTFYSWYPGGNAPAGIFSNHEFYVPNYTSAKQKTFLTDGVYSNSGSAAEMAFSAGLWQNTAPITSFSVVSSSGGFAQYSTATLYGIV